MQESITEIAKRKGIKIELMIMLDVPGTTVPFTGRNFAEVENKVREYLAKNWPDKPTVNREGYYITKSGLYLQVTDFDPKTNTGSGWLFGLGILAAGTNNDEVIDTVRMDTALSAIAEARDQNMIPVIIRDNKIFPEER